MIGERIKELRKQNKLTLQELATKLNDNYPNTINFNKGKISKWENNKEEPRLSSVKILADFFNVPLDYFGQEDVQQPKILSIYDKLENSRQEKVIDFATNQLKEQEQNNLAVLSDYQDEEYITDFVRGVVAAGHGAYQEDELYMEVKLLASKVPDKYDSIATVVGDSMEPLIHNNDLLFIEATNQVEPNSIGIFQVNGKNFVKKLKRDYDGAWYLQSLNNSYEEIYLSEDDDIRTIGEVVDIYKEG